MILRDYQRSIFEQIIGSDTDDVFQLDTGGGKTAIIKELAVLKPTLCIAHRNMLIEQISQTLSKSGIDHQIIGNSTITRRCQLFQRNHGARYGGNVWVATVQSLVSWFKNGKLDIDRLQPIQVIIDECHHVAEDNMWAQVKEIFPNARFIGPTATPCRLDGRGLHKECGGIFDRLVQAEQLKENSTQWLISNGYLADYECWCPPTNLDLSQLKILKDGEYSKSSMELILNKAQIAGSIVTNYNQKAKGKTAIIFSPTIMNAEEVAHSFSTNQISATYIASSLSFVENMRRIDAFRSGEVKVLVNVEMATEGFDLPEAQCLIMLRPTASFVLYKQMIGRVLRPKNDGSKAIIIDHVANAVKHGLPDDDIVWTLYGTPKNKSEPIINCHVCGFLHNPYLATCPNCNTENWIRADEFADDHLIKAKIIDINLVQRVRNHLKQQEIEQAKAKAKLEYELSLKTKIHAPVWRSKYGKNAVGQLCEKLSDWFVLNLADTDLSIKTINDFTLGDQPPLTFWSKNFTIKDLDTKNPDKCKQVFETWRSN